MPKPWQTRWIPIVNSSFPALAFTAPLAVPLPLVRCGEAHQREPRITSRLVAQLPKGRWNLPIPGRNEIKKMTVWEFGMRATSIDEKHKLDTSGNNKRQRFLSVYGKALTKDPSVTLVQESYSSLLDDVLGSTSYIFITVNLTRTNIQRVLDAKRRKAGGVLPDNFLVLGQEYYAARRSGESTIEAMESVWEKFFKRLKPEGSRSEIQTIRTILRWIRVYENETKRYCKSTNESSAHVSRSACRNPVIARV